MEQVLVVARSALEQYLRASGLITENCAAILDIIKEKAEFLPRAEAEKNPEFKQIIPYVSVTRRGKVYASQRLPAGGESRLHGLVSIGFGGHINPTDGEGDPLMDGLRRELDEELRIESPGEPRFLGVINDDTNDVGRVHLGALFVLESGGEVEVLEAEKLRGFWVERGALDKNIDKMEGWSRIAASAVGEAAL